MPKRKKIKFIQVEMNGYLVDAKECTKCREILPLSEYHNDKTKKNGKYGACKVCKNQLNKHYQQANKEKIKKRRKQYRKENMERIWEVERKYRENNKERIRKLQKRWKEQNKERIRESQKKWREQNKEYIKKYRIQYQWEKQNI